MLQTEMVCIAGGNETATSLTSNECLSSNKSCPSTENTLLWVYRGFDVS